MPRKYNPLLDEKLDYYETNAPGGGITNINISAGTTSNNLSAFRLNNANNVSFGLNGSTITASASYPAQTAFIFSDANGVSFGTNGSTVTATVATNYQSQGAYLTTAMASNRGSDFVQANAVFAGTNASGTIASNGISVSVGNYLTTAALSNHSHAFATTTTNGASIIVGTTNSLGATIGVPAYLTTAQPVGAYLTTARASNDAIGLNTALTANGVSVTANSSGLSLNFPAFLTTAQSPGAYLTTAMQSNAVTLSNIRVSGGTTSNLLSAITFADSNGVSFGLNAGTMTGTVRTNYASSDHSHGNPTLALTNLSGTTASASNGFTLSLSAAAGGGIANAAGTQTATSGTVLFNNSNGITFGMSNSSVITASYNSTQFQTTGNYLTTARASNDAVGLNTAQTNVTWTVNSSGISINGAGYAGTGTSATNASITLNSNGLAISVAAPGGGGAINVSAGTTSGNLQTVVFSNSNGVSFGLNGSTITGSVNAGGGGATYSMWPQQPMPVAVSSVYSGATTTTAGGSRTTISMYVAPVVVPYAVSFNKVFGNLSMNTSAGTGSVTMGNAYGLYTLNGDSLSRMSSWGMGFLLSQSSVTARTQSWYWGTNSTSNSSSIGGNQSASFARLNQVLYDTTPQSLSPGQYWLVHANTQASAGLAAALFSYFPVSFSQSTAGSMFGTNVSSRRYQLIGIASTVTSNTRAHNVGDILPPFIGTTAITGTGGSSQNRSNIVYFQSA